MSRSAADLLDEVVGWESDSPSICEFCGCEIDVVGQDCPALDEGACCP